MTKERRPNKRCAYCGRVMGAGGPGKRYCSAACRQADYRRRKKKKVKAL